MLKISQVPTGDRALLLRLEGKLLEPWIAEVENICRQAVDRSDELCLDLSAVTYADATGVEFLRDCLRRGVAITSCTGFVAELLRQEKRS